MSLTPNEEIRIRKIEESVAQLSHLVKNTGSKNMLNRLLALAQEQTKTLKEKVVILEDKLEAVLDLARKLQ